MSAEILMLRFLKSLHDRTPRPADDAETLALVEACARELRWLVGPACAPEVTPTGRAWIWATLAPLSPAHTMPVVAA